LIANRSGGAKANSPLSHARKQSRQ